MESLRELQFKAENDKLLSGEVQSGKTPQISHQIVDQFERLDTQTKTALTKYYNR